MSQFYGVVTGGKSSASRQGHKTTGLTVTAASWQGAVETRLWFDKTTGKDMYAVTLKPWHGAGIEFELARGIVGAMPDLSDPEGDNDRWLGEGEHDKAFNETP